jgi:hypothetical protein
MRSRAGIAGFTDSCRALPDVGSWHVASFRCDAMTWTLLEQEQTSGGAGGWMGRSKMTQLCHRPASHVAVAKPLLAPIKALV